MGQRHGKAVYEEGCIPFLNLSFAALERLCLSGRGTAMPSRVEA